MLKESCFAHKSVAVLLASDSPATASRLEQGLGDTAMLVRHGLDPAGICACVRDESPDIVLLDFQNEDGDPSGSKAAAAASALQEACPDVPLAAVCCYRQPHSAVAALRAGVREVADLDDAHGLPLLIQRLTDIGGPRRRRSEDKRRSSVLLMGARPGMGVSTLAVHMASLWQERLMRNRSPGVRSGSPAPAAAEDLPLRDRTGILDLGMPVGDCLLYLGLASDFHFVDAVRGIQRLDDTLLRSALAHDGHGVSVLAWPRDVQQISEVSYTDSLRLYERLKEHFGLLLVDVGGFSNPQFVAAMAQSADSALVVADQSVGSLISLAEVLRDLGRNGMTTDRVGLVLNRYDERYGMSASQVEQRFGTPLTATLPDRALQLRSSMNQGMLLHAQARRDPYVRAVERLIDSLAMEPGQDPKAGQGWWKGWRR
ncbi:pilus assembly protein CpaE [Paracandidimonas soli]|uniref:Pilus assembly protein CpaE n=1 Tax=Paracandidimonas soli TaxID=1917182 RepID=A0A4R3V6J5_9BURK|nr:pilus assembly protein CpaE [Paracandidimonas soli]TCV00626.1 pilus assembly protein CpaE [Paracandidimonas soli]